MNTLNFLVGGLALLIMLLFFALIAFLWGLRQLLNIGQQNDTMLILLHQISVNIWQAASMQAEVEGNKGNAVPTVERKLTLHRQNEAYEPEPRLASQNNAEMKWGSEAAG